MKWRVNSKKASKVEGTLGAVTVNFTSDGKNNMRQVYSASCGSATLFINLNFLDLNDEGFMVVKNKTVGFIILSCWCKNERIRVFHRSERIGQSS